MGTTLLSIGSVATRNEDARTNEIGTRETIKMAPFSAREDEKVSGRQHNLVR
jgi:hypothetical protein